MYNILLKKLKPRKTLCSMVGQRNPKTKKMSQTPAAGDCGFIHYKHGTWAGIWSVIVEAVEHQPPYQFSWMKTPAPAKDVLTLRFDGVVVPAAAVEGVESPHGIGSRAVQDGFAIEEFIPRAACADDAGKRTVWQLLISERKRVMQETSASKLMALQKVFAYVKPGMRVAWSEAQYGYASSGPIDMPPMKLEGTILSTNLIGTSCTASVEVTNDCANKGIVKAVYLPSVTFI